MTFRNPARYASFLKRLTFRQVKNTYQRFLHGDIDGISGRHHVIEIADFDEWLDLASLSHLLLAHLLGNFEGISGER